MEITRSFRGLVGRLLVLAPALALGCGTEGDALDVELHQGDIIGGSLVSNASQKALGLVSLAGCSGFLLDQNTALTATHCVAFLNPADNNVILNVSDTQKISRTASRAVQVGTTDMTILKLTGTIPSGWPTVTRTMSTTPSVSLEKKNVICYGRGNNQYVAGGGTTGDAKYRQITQNVLRYNPTDNYLALDTVNGTQTVAPSDSGGGCFYNSQPVGVVWKADADCAIPAACGSTITKIKEAHVSATYKYATYIDATKNRAHLPFRPIPTYDLLNGWVGATYSTNQPAFALDNGVVYLRGAMSNGTSNHAFTLPPGLRPSARVFLPVNTANATKGRLQIEPDGKVYVLAEFNIWGNAQGFTSLDGVSFAVKATGYSTIPLLNGWIVHERPVAVQDTGTYIRLQGSMRTGGTNNLAFNLPAGFRPSAPVYVPVDMFNGAKGRIYVDTNGNVYVQAENNAQDAYSFTSLEGVTFAKGVSGFLALTGSNGWTNYGTRGPGVTNRNGVVMLQGALRTSGTNMNALFLPEEYRPATSVYVPVDLCNAKKGRVLIKPDGWVTVQYQSSIGDAQCFTSLEGVQYGI